MVDGPQQQPAMLVAVAFGAALATTSLVSLGMALTSCLYRQGIHLREEFHTLYS